MALHNFSWVIPDKLAGSSMPGGTMPLNDSYITSDLIDLYEAGIRCLVSLKEMTPSFGALCNESGLEWISFPVADFSVPGNSGDVAKLVADCINRINRHEPVCVHCLAGVGRTGMILSCIVGTLFLLDGRAALQTVRQTRNAIDTTEQEAFVIRFLSQNGNK